jgi:uncharacterized protein YbaP (TraB family)
LVALPCAAPLAAQDFVTPAVQPVAVTGRPWVWEAERKGVKVYLAGCLHLGTGQDAAQFVAYLPYYQRAAAVYFEVIPGGWESREVGDLLHRRGLVAPSRGSLSSRISEAAWRDVRSTLGLQSPLLARLAPMEPWYAALTLTQEAYRKAGLQPHNGLDRYLAARAVEEGKPVGGLEKPRDQLLAMADAPLADQERVLRSALATYRDPVAATNPIRAAWRRGDLAELQRIVGADPLLQRGETHSNLLAKRNQQWVRKISSVAANGRPALFVMGVEHLVTRPSSLPELLEREGFSVRRVGGSEGSRLTAVVSPASDARP